MQLTRRAMIRDGLLASDRPAGANGEDSDHG